MGTGRPTEVITSGGLNDEEQVLDVVEELDRERDRPPPAIADAGKAAAERPQPDQHHDGIAVVESFGLDDPGKEVADESPRFRTGQPRP